MNANQVIDLFVDQGIVERNQVDDILAAIATSGKGVMQTLVDFDFVTMEQFYHFIATSLGVDYVDLSTFEPDAEVLRAIPAGLARLHGAFPVAANGTALTVALVDPLNSQILEDLRFALGKEIYSVVAATQQVEELIQKHYGADSASLDEVLADIGTEIEFGGGDGSLGNVEAEANSTPIVRYVDLVFGSSRLRSRQ